jgi:hypothetical protein
MESALTPIKPGTQLGAGGSGIQIRAERDYNAMR